MLGGINGKVTLQCDFFHLKEILRKKTKEKFLSKKSHKNEIISKIAKSFFFCYNIPLKRGILCLL